MFRKFSIRLRYPRSIYVMYLVAFIASLELVGPFMIPFFVEWGGLNQFWIFVLQGWFTFWIMVLEIPTGIVGDVWGRKLSYVIGLLLLAIGPIIYTVTPLLLLFFIGEFIFALGLSFVSGSEEAMIRDILKKVSLEDEMSLVNTRFRNFHYLGMVVASIVTILLSLEEAPLNLLFLSGSPLMFITLIIVIFGVKDERGGKERNGNSIMDEYKITFTTSKEVFKGNQKLWSLAIFVNAIALTGYFVIWFYQTYMGAIELELKYYPYFRVIFLLGQIAVSSFLVWLRGIQRFSDPKSQVWIAKGIVVLISIGAFVSLMLFNVYGLIVLLIVVGGFSINLRSVYSRDINDCIPDDERATVLSFISMGRNTSRTIANPLFGAAVDLNPSFGIIFMMAISRFTEIFALPSEADFIRDGGSIDNSVEEM